MRACRTFIFGIFIGFLLFLSSTNTVQAGSFCSTSGEEEFVICIDPGHGGSTGAGTQMVYDGVQVSEKDLTLKISQFVLEELSSYAHVKVVTTRTEDEYVKIKERAAFASSNQADVLISLHINSAGSYWAGPSILTSCSQYQPDNAKNPDIYDMGLRLSQNVEKQLLGLGMRFQPEELNGTFNGIIQNGYSTAIGAKTDVYYPDGSLSDYYGLIRYAKDYGIPAIIVEHAFLSYEDDYRKFLSNDEQLKKLALADVAGIVETFCLVK